MRGQRPAKLRGNRHVRHEILTGNTCQNGFGRQVWTPGVDDGEKQHLGVLRSKIARDLKRGSAAR